MKINDSFIKHDARTRLYNIPVPIIGVTGGIATGKSTVTRYFSEKGATVICADELVKIIYKKPETLHFIQSKFPEVVESANINFKLLREIFFNSKEHKEIIENYIFSQFKDEFVSTFKNLITDNELIFYDVPLLFEKNLQSQLDLNVCVYASKNIQIKRLMTRDNIDRQLSEKILRNQLPIDDKKKMADVVINNEAGLETLNDNCNLFLTKYCTY